MSNRLKSKESSCLPNFLVIGAMKAGTTTLHYDLSRHPDIAMPIDKETAVLLKDDILSERGYEHYCKVFPTNAQLKLRGDASTQYSKMPEYEDIPRRAHALLGPSLKIIYVVRNPVDRIVSHFLHDRPYNRTPSLFEAAIKEDLRLLNYSRYAYQLKEWLQYFSHENFLIIPFENYIRAREETVKDICDFLGLANNVTLDKDDIHNRTVDKRYIPSVVQLLIASRFYRKNLRVLLPTSFRGLFYRVLAQKIKQKRPEVSPADELYLWEHLEKDQQEFFELCGFRYRGFGSKENGQVNYSIESCSYRIGGSQVHYTKSSVGGAIANDS